jgi:hypothetical protein
MSTPPSVETNASLTRDLLHAARYYLLSRTGIVILATIAIVAGLAANWSWLVAIGIAPILLAVLPCAVMCALGLCMSRLFGGPSAAQSPPHDVADRSADRKVAPSGSAVSPGGGTCCQGSPEAAAAQEQPQDERRTPHA